MYILITDSSRWVVGVTPCNVYPNFLNEFLASEPVSSTHTNISRLNRKQCAIKAPRNASRRCKATCLIFFLVIPHFRSSLQIVEGDTLRWKASYASWHTSLKYMEGLARIKPTIYSSVCSSKLFRSSLLGLPMWKINLQISNNLYHAHKELTDAKTIAH